MRLLKTLFLFAVIVASVSGCAFFAREAPRPRAPGLPYEDPSVPEAEKICSHLTCFDSIKKYGGETFFLRGISLRKFLWVDVYSAAFYLPETTRGSETRGVPGGAKMLILHYHRPVPKDRIVENIIKEVNSNPSVDQAAVRPRFDALTEAFIAPLSGSSYIFVYIPEEGTSLIQEGRVSVTLPGEDFAFAFFAIWLDNETEDQPMREELLGLR